MCRRYGISLNPRNSNFNMKEGKFLGHIISKDGIRIDLDRVNSILKVEEPRSKKEMQYFIGQVKFLRRFIPSFAKILINITSMLKKDNEIKWIVGAIKYFKHINKAITTAPVLVSPYFSKYFLVFSYASDIQLLDSCYRKMNKMLKNLFISLARCWEMGN